MCSFEDHRRTVEMSKDMSMDVDPEFVYSTPPTKVKLARPATEKNAHLKGRKRFNADLDDIKEESISGIAQHGYKVKSRFNFQRRRICIGSTIILTLSEQKYAPEMMRVQSRSSSVVIVGDMLLLSTFSFLILLITRKATHSSATLQIRTFLYMSPKLLRASQLRTHEPLDKLFTSF